MTGQRGLDRDLRGLEVADLADHDHVRVLAEDGAQPAGEGHVDAQVHLGLADAVEVILDRVLDGEDVAAAVVEPCDGGVERGGLAGTGGTGDQQDPVGAVDEGVDLAAQPLVHTQVLQVQAPRLLVEQTQHHAFAVAAGQGGDAHVHRAPGDAQRDPSVLGDTLLGDVQPGHDLDARDQQRGHAAWRLQDLAEHAVDAKAHRQPRLEGFDVHVRGALADGLGEQRVDQPDDGRVILALEEVFRLGHGLGEAGEVHGLADVLHRLHGLAGTRLVGLLEQPLEVIGVQALDAQGHAEAAAEVRDHGQRGVGAADDVGAGGVHRAHQHAVAAGEAEGRPPCVAAGLVVLAQRFGGHGAIVPG
ncbi:hypothetical protein KBTX_03543 [wastewater metagenome]|uniref:Uncharacterized protein n=2 Tax=unclassified sequences TaxID=12908 RepID=A0A5B8RF44_9ZZZZ|nr:hypothetical protein KBTEX_03543 [uncultured organism]